jgi:uncharacterized protein YbaP (TraB family)
MGSPLQSADAPRPARRAFSGRRLIGSLLLGLMAVVARPAKADPALWVIRSPTATVYLFGTVHRLPPNVQWHTTVIDRALASSQEVWTEADTGTMPSLVRLIRRYGLNPRVNLRNVLPARYRTRYDTEMSSAGLNVDQFGHVKPWLAEMLLTGATMRHAAGYGVEIDLLAYARKHHKDTPTFETADQQFSILSDLPMASQARALELQIDGYPSADGRMNGLVRAWLAGDDQLVNALSNKPLSENDERYFTDVIVRRNENFAQAIATRLAGSGTAFVAIGAAHLCGPDSVQYFLKNYGMTAERIGPAKAAS